MKGLKIIPFFLVLILLSYVGVLFVQLNPAEISVVFFGGYESPPLAMGFVVLTSALVGMLLAGVLCLLELVVLYVQNKSLRRKLSALTKKHGVVEANDLEDDFGLKRKNGSKALGGNGQPKKGVELDKKSTPSKTAPEAKP